MKPVERTSRDLLPPLAALVLVVLFASLGAWQLDRAGQKRAIQDAFTSADERQVVEAGVAYPLYQPLVAEGRYLPDRQFLIDNMILDGRLGYFVVAPFEYARDQPLLLVNRGWVPKTPADTVPEAPDVGSVEASVRGRAGQLPRVGIRAGEVFPDNGGWPRLANWPTLDHLSAALDREVLPFVLLQDPEPGAKFVRQWEPRQVGPMRHIGYAFQWFALAAAVVVTTFVLYRRNRARR